MMCLSFYLLSPILKSHMKLTFCGASHEVTGSCYLLETSTKRFLIDCGMFQGSDFNEAKNGDPFPFDPKTIDAVLVTHAHLDHTGRIPKLIRDGFSGRIFMTKATIDLARLVWDDAYGIMEYNHRKFQAPILYNTNDIANASAACEGVDYGTVVDLGGGVSAVWKDAGHIFGAAFIEITADGKTIAFSGDIGNVNVPILKDTESLGEIDTLLCESTYGDRIHEDIETRRATILRLVKEGVAKGGTIMVPSFSIERTQEFLFELHKLSEHDQTLPQIPIFLDSPLAIDATKVFKRYPEYYDEEAEQYFSNNDDFLNFPQLRIAYTIEESKRINNVRGPKMVIAGSGMMNGGRIQHHALRYLSDPNSTLIIVGYQAVGTPGRRIYEGAKTVRVLGQEVDVRCAVKAIGALSAHGDQAKLLHWVGTAKKMPKEIYCVHGEPHAATELAHRLRDMYKVNTFVPGVGDVVEI